jgi:hypothetical protein
MGRICLSVSVRQSVSGLSVCLSSFFRPLSLFLLPLRLSVWCVDVCMYVRARLCVCVCVCACVYSLLSLLSSPCSGRQMVRNAPGGVDGAGKKKKKKKNPAKNKKGVRKVTITDFARFVLPLPCLLEE